MNAQIVYLPDLARPTYARLSGILGKADYTIQLEGGMPKSISHHFDATESMKPITELIKSLVDAYKSVASPVGAVAGGVPAAGGDPEAFSAALYAASDLDTKKAKVLGDEHSQELRRIAESVRKGATRPSDHLARLLSITANTAQELKKATPDKSESISAILNELNRAIRIALAESGQAPQFELYEIIISPAGTELRKVPIKV